MEVWRNINRLNGLIAVSNTGLVRNNNTGKILKTTVNKVTGYIGVSIKPNGRSGKTILIRLHRELALLYIDNPLGLPQVNHKDGNKLNNAIENLEWCTAQFNTKHAHDNKLTTIHRGHANSQSKLSKQDREFILNNYSRYDVSCTGRALAEKFGVDKMQIYRIIKRGY